MNDLMGGRRAGLAQALMRRRGGMGGGMGGGANPHGRPGSNMPPSYNPKPPLQPGMPQMSMPMAGGVPQMSAPMQVDAPNLGGMRGGMMPQRPPVMAKPLMQKGGYTQPGTMTPGIVPGGGNQF